MSAPIADGVMAATHKLVQQAMTGQWQEVPKTIQERRDLLARLSSCARPQDQQWLDALRQAMSESDAAVSQMAQAANVTAAPGTGPVETPDAVATIMDMLGKGP
ncbi:MAG TPA: hypothetical protein VJT80_23085 [Steroidobacteraceae bacterium]|nr:hypothetical protein [Steroidobacteraceae bacterium]